MAIINFNDSTMSRLKSEVIRVRGVRSLDTNESDAFADGIRCPPDRSFGLAKKTCYHSANSCISYWSIWKSISGNRSTEVNPWPWTVSVMQINAAQEGKAS